MIHQENQNGNAGLKRHAGASHRRRRCRGCERDSEGSWDQIPLERSDGAGLFGMYEPSVSSVVQKTRERR